MPEASSSTFSFPFLPLHCEDPSTHLPSASTTLPHDLFTNILADLFKAAQPQPAFRKRQLGHEEPLMLITPEVKETYVCRPIYEDTLLLFTPPCRRRYAPRPPARLGSNRKRWTTRRHRVLERLTRRNRYTNTARERLRRCRLQISRRAQYEGGLLRLAGVCTTLLRSSFSCN